MFSDFSIFQYCVDDDDDEDEDEDDSQKSSSVSVGRQQLKQCTALLNEIMKRDDAEYFLDPVDTDEVNNHFFILWKYRVALFLWLITIQFKILHLSFELCIYKQLFQIVDK